MAVVSVPLGIPDPTKYIINNEDYFTHQYV